MASGLKLHKSRKASPTSALPLRGIRTEITGIRAEIPVPIPVLTASGTFWPHHSPLRLILSAIYAEWRKEKKTNGGLAVERGMNNCYFRVGTQALKGGCSKNDLWSGQADPRKVGC